MRQPVCLLEVLYYVIKYFLEKRCVNSSKNLAFLFFQRTNDKYLKFNMYPYFELHVCYMYP